jgi:hypothetical protein
MLYNLTEEWANLNRFFEVERELSAFFRRADTAALIVEEAKANRFPFTPQVKENGNGQISILNLNESGVVITRRGKGGGTWVTEKILALAKSMFEHKPSVHSVNTLRCEESCLKTIEQIKGVTLERQYPCLTFRIDGYDLSNKIAYEIDGKEHRNQTKEDTERENKIKSTLHCTFIRIKL